MRGAVEYTLAKRALLRAFRAGHVSRLEICDAHPDLLRAANYSGERTSQLCPVCNGAELLLVSYAFSEGFPKRERQHGRLWTHEDVGPLLQEFGDVRLYTVEVCTACSWNHLRSQLAFSATERRRGREASK